MRASPMQTTAAIVLLVAFAATAAVALETVAPTPTPKPTSTPLLSKPTAQPLPDGFRGRVAFACGRDGAAGRAPAMVWSPEGRWRPEPTERRCLANLDDIRDFCLRVYPGLAVTNVEPAVELEAFPNWCPGCPIINVRPYECLSGPYQSPSLLVTSGCLFRHNSSDTPNRPASCRRVEYWEGVAQRACSSDGGKELARYGLLLPCDFVPRAGYFAGVEFVCCPKVRIEVSAPSVIRPVKKPAAASHRLPVSVLLNKSPSDFEAAAAAASASVAGRLDADDARYQRYLAVATESGHSEHERFADAKRGLRHHQARRESAMMSELRAAESRIASLSPRDPDSAKRLLAEVEKQFRRSFLSVQREEEAEHDQLDSVHQQRVGLLFVGKLRRVKRLLAESVAERNAKAAERYFARLAGLITREVVRVANRATRLSSRLAASHLSTLRRHADALLADLSDSGADAGLRRVAGIESVAAALSEHAGVLKKAQIQLADAKAAAGDSAAYPPKLAERFDNLLRLYHEQSVRVMAAAHGHKNAGKKIKAEEHDDHHDDESKRARLPRLHLHKQHHQQHHRHQDQYHPILSKSLLHIRPASSSPLFIGLICGLAIVMVLAGVLVALRLCRGAGGSGKKGGYKLSLVDDDYSVSAASSASASSSTADAAAPYDYPTVRPEKAGLGDAHLANMQMNGYENPTYKFYEEK